MTFISLELSKFQNLPIQTILNSYLLFAEIHSTESDLSYISHYIRISEQHLYDISLFVVKSSVSQQAGREPLLGRGGLFTLGRTKPKF